MTKELEPQTKKDSTWGWGIATVLAVFVLFLMGSALYFSFQPDDLIRKKYYTAGLHYDSHMDKMRNAQEIGDVIFCTLAKDGKSLVITWSDSIKVSKVVGNLTLYRPSRNGWDRSFKIEPDQDGIQQIDLTRIPKGRWILQVDWQIDEKSYFYEEDLIL